MTQRQGWMRAREAGLPTGPQVWRRESGGRVAEPAGALEGRRGSRVPARHHRGALGPGGHVQPAQRRPARGAGASRSLACMLGAVSELGPLARSRAWPSRAAASAAGWGWQTPSHRPLEAVRVGQTPAQKHGRQGRRDSSSCSARPAGAPGGLPSRGPSTRALGALGSRAQTRLYTDAP